MIFFPYRDDNPTRSFPVVNWLFILTNIWVYFAYQLPLSPGGQEAYFANFGFIPAAFFGQFSQDDLAVVALCPEGQGVSRHNRHNEYYFSKIRACPTVRQ